MFDENSFTDASCTLRPENQQQKQVEVRFHSRSYIGQRDQIDYVSGGATINYIILLISYGFN